MSLRLTHIENHLSTAEAVLCRGDNALGGKLQTANALQSIGDPLLLDAQLFFIAHVAQRAAAAPGIYRAIGLLTGSGCLQKLFAPTPYGTGAYFYNANQPPLALQSARDEHRPTLQTADAVAFGRTAVDYGFIYLIFGQFQNTSPSHIIPEKNQLANG
jgi:hypothetical protein